MSHKSKRILMFSTNYLPHIGGAELALNEITKRINNFQFDLVTSHLDKKLASEEKIGNVMVYRTGDGNAFLNLILPKNLFPMYAYLKARQLSKKKGPYDYIFALQASQGAGAAWLYKIFNRKIPFVLNIQEGKPLERQGFLVNFFRKLILRKADIIISISNYLNGHVQKINSKARTLVIPNGVDTQMFKISAIGQKNSKVIITVSRLVEKNGVSDLIKSLKYLDDIKLMIIGKGHLEEKLRKEVQDLELENRVEFLGEIAHEQLPKYLSLADVFVRPSLSEGLGSAFIEAMAAGLPVIGTPVGGITDLIKDKETGLLCRVGDPKDIAEKIQVFFSDLNLRQKIVSNARKLVDQDYNWDIIAAKFEEIWNTKN